VTAVKADGVELCCHRVQPRPLADVGGEFRDEGCTIEGRRPQLPRNRVEVAIDQSREREQIFNRDVKILVAARWDKRLEFQPKRGEPLPS
jgi:hypothetical protein